MGHRRSGSVAGIGGSAHLQGGGADRPQGRGHRVPPPRSTELDEDEQQQGAARARCSLCGAYLGGTGGWCASCMTSLGAACAACGATNPRLAKFCTSCGFKLAEAGSGKAAFRSDGPAIERRRVTAVFCDLVGSTTLATSMDAEDYTELIGMVFRRVTELVERFGGFVAHYLGDGILSYFGYPSANENDTEHAVRAALAMAGAVSAVALPDGRQLAVRVGVAAGEVIAGDIVGTGSPRGLDVAGELPSLAARLQTAAEPGTVLVDDTVFRTVGRLFECRGLGRREFKGWSAAVPVWQVLWPAASGRRFEACDASPLSPLVGRASETALLANLWQQARAGSGRAVLVVGDPGIGKSRLVADLLKRTATDSHARLYYVCSALQQGVPLAPFITEIERTASLAPDDRPLTARAKLRAVVGSATDRDFELICDLMGIAPLASRPVGTDSAAQLSPRKRRERTIAVLIGGAIRLSEDRPVLVVFEDAHWSDPTSADLLDLAVRSIGGRPILLIVTARPEFKLGWAEHASVEIIELSPLSAVESRELVGWVAGDAGALTREAVKSIAARSDGVPLFIEELTKAVLESGTATGVAATYWPHSSPSVPAALHSSLLARLDRLGTVREIAEVAAVIGRDFSLELLARVTGQEEAELWPALSRLVESDLVTACLPGGYQFRFKHALIQDAAYGIIVRGRRRALHARIVQALEAHFAALAAVEPQLLAYHSTEAGFGEKAATWWLRAGIQSLVRSAASEAVAQLARGLAAMEALPPTRARDQLELDLRLAYAKALIATQGNAASSTAETFAIARNLCERLGRPPQFLIVLYGQWSQALFRADLRSARYQAEEILQSAEERQDSLGLVAGCYCLGITSLTLGRFDRACDHFRRGLAIAAAPGRTANAGPFASDPVVVMRTHLCRALMCLGHLDEARRECAAALEDARRLGEAFTLAFALWEEAYLTLMTVSIEAALPKLKELQRFAGEHGITFHETLATLFRGWSQAMLGDHAAGLARLREGRDLYVGAANLLYIPSYMRMEAEILGRTGRPEEGLLVLAQGERLKDETGARWDEAEFERTRGGLLWACGRPAEAEDTFRRAIQLAQARSAGLFELRAALALADLLVGAGRRAEAAAQLAPVCASFERRGSCADLARARRMLTAVAAAE